MSHPLAGCAPGGIRTHSRPEYRHETYVLRTTTPRARRAYECDYCGEIIPAGSYYVTFTTRDVDGPGLETWRLHGECCTTSEPMFENSGRPSWRWSMPWVCEDCGQGYRTTEGGGSPDTDDAYTCDDCGGHVERQHADESTGGAS